MLGKSVSQLFRSTRVNVTAKYLSGIQHIKNEEYADAITDIANSGLFDVEREELDAHHAEQFLILGNCLYLYASRYPDLYEKYVQEIHNVNDTNQELENNPVQPVPREDMKKYFEYACICFENCIAILRHFDFDSEPSKQVICLAYLKYFQVKKELQQQTNKYKELVNYVALYDVKPRKFKFYEELKAILLENLEDDEDKDTVNNW